MRWFMIADCIYLFCVEQKKRCMNGSSSATKYEGKRKQKRNLKQKRVRHNQRHSGRQCLKDIFKSHSFSILNTEGGINLHVFIHSSISHDMSIWSRHCHIMDLCGFNVCRDKNQIAAPPPSAVVWHSRLSFQGLSAEERKRKWERWIVEAVVLLSLTAALRTV